MNEFINKKLIEEVTSGSIGSFTNLFEIHRPALYAKALMLLGYGDEAKDALHETFITAFSKIHQLKDPYKFSGWIHTILKNHCLLIHRDRKKNFSADHFLQIKNHCIPTPSSVEDFLENQNLNSSLLEVIAQLEEKKRVVVLLRFYSEYSSYQEIAKILSVPIGTVRSRLALAKKELHATISRLRTIDHYSDLKQRSEEYEEGIREAWTNFYRGDRKGFLEYFDKNILIRFSSGKKDLGIKRWAEEWDIDLVTGVRFKPNYVINSGNLTIVEGPIINPPDKPDHCPPEGGFVFFHQKGAIYKTHVHYAPRKKNRI